MIRPPPRSTLFPYTTLFRSSAVKMQPAPFAPGAAGEQTSVVQVALSLQAAFVGVRSEEHTSELQSQSNLVCRLLLEKKNMVELLLLRLSQSVDSYLTPMRLR